MFFIWKKYVKYVFYKDKIREICFLQRKNTWHLLKTFGGASPRFMDSFQNRHECCEELKQTN